MTKTNILRLCKKIITLSLAFSLLFNTSVEAFVNLEIPAELKTEIQTIIKGGIIASPQEPQNPRQFLANLAKQMEKAAQSNSEDQATAKEEYHKLSKEKYIALYNENIDNQYNHHVNEIENVAQNALNVFDTQAQQLIDEQKISVTDTSLFGVNIPSPNQFLSKTSKEMNFKLDSGSYAQEMNNITTRQNFLDQIKKDLDEQKEKYAEEVNTWKQNALISLKNEKKKLLKDSDAAYENYSQEYSSNIKEFYTSLIEEIIENYKRTDDMESKKNFVSILFFLTSIKSSEIDRNDFITGESRKFILNFLQNNFSVESNACAASVKITYDSNYTYGSAAIGGSPSAGHMYDTQASKTPVLEIADEDKCDLALSSMIPYANLNGNGYAITDFVQQYYEQPLFGSMLEIAVKSLLLTDNKGEEALSKFIDNSIELENKARTGKTSFWGKVWDGLDIFTAEGIANRLVYDGKFCNHNLCSSASGGQNNPNSWEHVAYMLADAQKTDLLNKAIDQCKIVATEDHYQHMECKGIYPFLFGALIANPELANRINPVKPFPEFSGQYIDKYGTQYVTEQEAEANKIKNKNYDITNKHTQGEWVAALLTLQSFEDVHPAEQLRMNNLVAKSEVLNPKQYFQVYTDQSPRYKKNLRKYNEKQVLLPLSSYADFLIAIIATKDLLRFGFLTAHKAVKFAKIMRAIRTFKALPNSVSKAIKLTRLLEASKISPKSFAKANKFIKFNQHPLHHISSAVVAKVGGESQALIASVSGRITEVKNGVRVGSQEFLRPISGQYAGKVAFKPTPLGGMYPAAGADAFKVVPEVDNPTNLKSLVGKIWNGIKYNYFSPFLKPDTKDVPNLDLSKLSVELIDKNGNPVKIEKITIEDKVLYINDQMFKTFKATLPEDQLEILNQLIKSHNIELGIDGFYVKPLWKQAPTGLEKVAARWKNNELFNIYDPNGGVMMQIGLNRGYKQDLNLLNKLDLNSAKLIYTNNALFLKEGANLTRLEGLKGISLPKTAIFNMAKNSKVNFLTDLFSMPLRADKTAPLKLNMTRSKIFWPYMTQALSYSAASTSLMLTMEKPPFNFTPVESVAIGLFLPYIWSFASPFMVPLVKMWGAKPVLLGSLAVAGLGLGTAIATGYHGNVTNELDAEGRVIPKRDDNGNVIAGSYELRKDPLPAWPLYIASAATGLASAGIRASANILIKGYELNRSTLTVSMVFKNIGGMAFTAVPFVANSLAKMDNDYFKDKRKDFSVTYPVLLGLTAVAGTGIALRMPKMNVPHYKPVAADFLTKPWKLLFTPQIAPYTIGMMGVCSLEGYAYFKGANAFARNTFEDYGSQAENAKFMATLFTTIPQFTLRLLSPRKVFYGRGLFNSAALATTGTLLLTLPSDNLSRGQNTALGLIAGTALGLGTAQVYQYSQQLVISQAAKMPGAPIKDAQTLYSMSNLGLVLPTVYAISANKRKEELNESEFEATRNTFYWPLILYSLGAFAIADAERGFKVFPRVMKNVVKPTLRYSIEGSTLKNTINGLNTNFKPTLLPNHQFTFPTETIRPDSLQFTNPIFPPMFHISLPSETSADEINTEENPEE